MFTSIFVGLLLELLALIAIAICIGITAVIVIIVLAIIVWFIGHAVKVLIGEFKTEEETDDTREHQSQKE